MADKRYFIPSENLNEQIREKVKENFENVREDSAGLYYQDKQNKKMTIDDDLLNESLEEMNE